MESYMVISILGKNQSGIVHDLSEAASQYGCSIADSRMTVLGNEFAAVLLIEGSWSELAKMETGLTNLEKKYKLSIIIRRTEAREPQPELVPYIVQVITLDTPGVLNKITEFFSERNIPIEEVYSNTFFSSHTGAPMATMTMTVLINATSSITELREAFILYTEEHNLDAVFEPDKS